MKSTLNSCSDSTPRRLPRLVEPEVVRDVCRDLGIKYRRRLLDPLTTLNLLLIQVLHGNTALNDLRHKAALAVSASAICKARARLPLAFFHEVLARLGRRWRDATAEVELWRGRRVMIVDGSGASASDVAALRDHYGQPPGQKPGCGFPVMRLLGMIHAGTGLLLEWRDAPLFSSEQTMTVDAASRLCKGDVLVGDRAFGCYPVLAALVKQGLDAVMRINQCMIVDFNPGRPHAYPKASKPEKGLPRSRWVRAIGTCDQVVEWPRPSSPARGLDAAAWAALPRELRVRETRYRVEALGFRTREVTLVTTLLDEAAFPADALAELYFQRWGIEGCFRDLKITMRMDVLKCKSVDGVRKELATYALAYNLIRLSALEGARRAGAKPWRISFVDAMRWLATTAIRGWTGPPDLIVNPSRPGRYEPRVRKRRPKAYPLMTKPRDELKQLLVTQSVTP
jgi:hypothetical protein